jgi:hypothetical protein
VRAPRCAHCGQRLFWAGESIDHGEWVATVPKEIQLAGGRRMHDRGACPGRDGDLGHEVVAGELADT